MSPHPTPLPPGYRLAIGEAEADAEAAHAFLARSYWSPDIPLETVRKAIRHSLCASVHHRSAQVGMARLVTDRATFAYLADVYVLEPHRGHGLAQAMVAALQALPDLAGLRRWLLFTRDAHQIYAGLGWTPLDRPERVMLREFPDIYQSGAMA